MMKKTDLILKLSDNVDLSKADTKVAIELVLEALTLAIASGKGVEIRGFGAFYKRCRPAHQGINPKTGERVQIEEKFLPFFKPGQELKTLVNKA